MNSNSQELIKIAVSSCLTGHAVRYDGEHQSQQILHDLHSNHFELLTVCPEVAINLGIPREAIFILEQENDTRQYRLVQKSDYSIDHSNKMLSYANQFIHSRVNISGYIVKERSPSCGYRDTPRFYLNSKGRTVIKNTTNTRGYFIEQIESAMPWLPIISEQALYESTEHDNFIERVFILNHWHRHLEINNNIELFWQQINEQITVRGHQNIDVLIAKYQNSGSENNHSLITEIMAILTRPITIEMNYHFLTDFLTQKNNSSKSMYMINLLNQYKDNRQSFISIIKQFRKIYVKDICQYSNYFYPSIHELKMRKIYFGQ